MRNQNAYLTGRMAEKQQQQCWDTFCQSGRIADYLIDGHPVTVTAGQEKTDYEKKKPQNIRFRKNTKNMAVKQINCGGRTRAPGLCRTGIFQKRDYVLNT